MTDEEIEAFKQDIRDYYLIERGIIVNEEQLEALFQDEEA